MRSIQKYVEHIKEELEGAKDYAEKYVECKAKGNMHNAERYKEMAADELRHATYVHEMAVADIQELNKIFRPPVEMQETWDKAHKNYVEQVAWIKTMLAM